MRFFRSRTASGPQPGSPWDGFAAWCSDSSVDHRAGFYALTDDGRDLLRPLVRLTMIDDAPGNPENGACHLVVSGPDDPPQAPAGRIVEFDVSVVGRAEVQS